MARADLDKLQICRTKRQIFNLSCDKTPMPTPNPVIQQKLDAARQQLAAVKAEKARLFPPNPDPLGTPDRFPRDYSPEQIEQHRRLNEQIELLEQRVDELELQLYSK
ncbi:MAG: hypothetical protein DCC52_12795 [Chloroflexi bacterium]|nr:MAG: hypothetical protein DCC52_12795 [Chloroflexota bacterium]